jgi:hypothetical protein
MAQAYNALPSNVDLLVLKLITRLQCSPTTTLSNGSSPGTQLSEPWEPVFLVLETRCCADLSEAFEGDLFHILQTVLVQRH